jgi:uncharacterized protein (TIGR00255 family)
MAVVLSLTGYATVQGSIDGSAGAASASGTLGLEVRSVNGRFLDLALRLPDELRQAEPALRELINAHLKRGKVELRVSLDTSGSGALRPPSAPMLRQLGQLQQEVLAHLPQASPLSVAEVLRLSSQPERPAAELQARLLGLAQQAVQELVAARRREGERLVHMLRQRTEQLHGLARQAEPLVPQLVAQQKARFLERWREAMALADGSALPETAQERALTEATAYAIRIDVAEELTRLNSHLVEIDRLLQGGGDIGKRLDFLIQELHREANTLGSKSATLELTRISVDMKVLIEQMREQVQNIE